jgi:large subunit ribosomal protein L5
MKKIHEKAQASYQNLHKEFGYTNVMQAPRITKVVVSAGVGSVKDKKKIELVADRLGRITGQKVSVRGAKKSIASFKVREGDVVGYQATLRGKRMYDFLEKLVNVALPRTRDFRGLTTKAVDEMGNYTLGIKEHTIFPETADEELKDVFGLSVTVVTTSKDKKQTEEFLRTIGFPFKKEEAKTK